MASVSLSSSAGISARREARKSRFRCSCSRSASVNSESCWSGADRVEEGFEVGGLVEAFRLGQLHLLEGASAGLDFPDDLQLFAERVVFDRGEAHQVLRPFRSRLRNGHALAHIGHYVAPLPYNGELPLLGN